MTFGSSEANVNVAEVLTVVGSGPLTIVVSGGSMSIGGWMTFHVWDAGVGSVFGVSARSIARASNVRISGNGGSASITCGFAFVQFCHGVGSACVLRAVVQAALELEPRGPASGCR